MIRSNFRNLAALTLFAALALCAWARADRAAAATPPAKSLPPDVAKLFDQFVGDWNASDLRLEAGGQVMKGTSKVHCTKTESGMALQCRLLVSAPGMQIDDTNLLGWNGETGEVHLFCAGNGSPAHDHKGRFDGTTLTVENVEPRGGKPQLDRVVFSFKGPRELYWKSSTAVDGKTVVARGDRSRSGPEDRPRLRELVSRFAHALDTRSGGLPMFASCAELLGDRALAARLYDRMRPWSGRYTCVVFESSYDHVLARLATLLGRDADARKHHQDDLADCRRIGARAWERRAVVGLAGLLQRSEGDYWTVRFGNTETRHKDSKGLRMLVELVQHPGRELHALQLTALATGEQLVEASAAATADARARGAYKARAAELQAELREAEANADLGRAERAREELELLANEIAGSVGLGGRERAAGSSAERARINVQRRISDAIQKLERAHAELGRHLSRSIKTGNYCIYDP